MKGLIFGGLISEIKKMEMSHSSGSEIRFPRTGV